MRPRSTSLVRSAAVLLALSLGAVIPAVYAASDAPAPAAVSPAVAAAPDSAVKAVSADSAAATAEAERKNGKTEEPTAAAEEGKTEEPAAAEAGTGAGAVPGCDPGGNTDTPYERPATPESPFRPWRLRLLDIGVFTFMLAAGTWVVISGRRRVWFFGMLLLSAAYLGFFRHGCICSVGSIGNVAQAAVAETRAALHLPPASVTAPAPAPAQKEAPAPAVLPPAGGGDAAAAKPSFILPVEAIVFFVLPLLLALACGRVFCGTVCPLGAVQHFLARKSLRVPRWLDRVLRVGPWLMLAWALVSAWVWLGLPICRLDPFVPLFRLTAHHPVIWGYTGGALLLSIFVARPYCRWLCPYGALLGLVSRLALRSRCLDAGRCVRCNRCVKACPVDAITMPPSGSPEQPALDFAACIQCGRCSRACGKHAIH